MEELQPGTELAGKYKIEKVVGRGGMGIVYKAEDTKLKRHVALKFLPPELIQDEDAKTRFVLEAQAAAGLSHPNICTIHEINDEERSSFIAMEYIVGQTLKAKLKKGALEEPEALDTAIQIAQGLDEAHRKGITHRDIKSANIMITEKGQAKVMDFGLAKVKGGTLLTREGTTLGTVAYMSPEQARGEEVDQRTDIWSLGVVLYEMLSGELPFKGDLEASVLYSVVHEEPRPLKEIKRDLSPELQQIINRALKKNPEARYSSTDEMLKDLKKYQDFLRAEELGAFNMRTFFRRVRKPRVAIPAICAAIVIALAAVWFFNRQAKIRWARDEILPEVERMIAENDVWRNLVQPYNLAVQAEAVLGNHPKLVELFSKCALNVDIRTEPSGARVYMKEYTSPDSEWIYLGVTPIEKARVPVGIFRWKFEKEGYESVLAAASTWASVATSSSQTNALNNLSRVLDKEGSLPPDMVRVEDTETPTGKIGEFFIDKYEVTNRQFKEFVDAGGYDTREYWAHPFRKDGREVTWEEAIAEFVDQTGLPGPSTWYGGDFPEGQADYPVSGICWHEAASYAKFAGKSLPTSAHWNVARGAFTPMILAPQLGGFAVLAPFCNFQGKGPVPVGSLNGISPYGAYDMAGNVREWCWNETPEGRLVRGGAWDDSTYMFNWESQSPPFDRSAKNGFRCALYPEPETMPKEALRPLSDLAGNVPYIADPVPDPVFQVYKEQFAYDRTELNPHVEYREESPGGWIREKVSFDAAYGDERVLAYLFLPKNARPPYQTVVYGPADPSVQERSSEGIEDYFEFFLFLSHFVKNGRAVVFPVWKGTFERGNDALASVYFTQLHTHQHTMLFIEQIKDFRRTIDYLETRPDIDGEKLAYYGMCSSTALGAIILAVEERFKTSVLVAGGLCDMGRPEISQINYITRVKTPTLMLNGKYDSLFPLATCSKPFFDLLETPDEHKELKLYETDHIPPRREFIKETLAWLDKYLGPVNR
jgi:serine/threonine protein kinase/dienelactone hydrolase